MAYERTVWKNREVERPRTFEKIENPDGTITLVPAEGNIIESGTPIIAENMNNIEQGIEDAHNEINAHKAEKVQHLSYATASGTNTYTTTIIGISSLVEGMSVKIKFTNANTGASTLNINGLGAKSIRKSNGNTLSSGNIKAGQICHLVYTGSVFQLLGEGGEYGTAQAQDVLSGKTFGTEEGVKSGTMPNIGSQTGTVANQGGQIAIKKGYHSGTGFIKASFPNCTPENIKNGVNVGGVVGTLMPKKKVASSYATRDQITSGITVPFNIGLLIISRADEVSGTWKFVAMNNLFLFSMHPNFINNTRYDIFYWDDYIYNYNRQCYGAKFDSNNIVDEGMFKFDGSRFTETNLYYIAIEL